jgi:ATP-binding cassette, subfamily B, bacterial MsbA
MSLKLPKPLRNLLKATRFWQDNYLIFREFKHFRLVVILALIFTLLTVAFEGIGIGFLLSFLQSLTNPNATPSKTGMDWFDVKVLGIHASVNERIYRISALILLTTLLRSLFSYLSEIYSGISQSRLAYQIRLRLFEQLQALSQAYFTKTRSGELVNSLTAETLQVMQFFDALTFVFVKTSSLAVYTLAMFLLSWQLTVLSAMLFGLLSVGLSTLIKWVRENSFVRTQARGFYTSTALEFINGIRTVQAFAAQDFERKRFYRASHQLLMADIKSFQFRALVEPIAESTATTVIILMLLFAFTRLNSIGELNVASLLTFLFILFRLMPIVRQLNGGRAKITSFQGSIDNIKRLLATNDKPYLKSGTIQFSGLKRSIEFRAVDFAYEADNFVLHNLTLTIERGKTTALVGSSGAGKTTIADLIPRFYDPTQGEILVDGIDLRSLDVYSLRRKLSVVSQDTFIFNASVRDNIAYALEDVDEATIWKAADFANALAFIQELPDGLNTQLGDRGVRLSGGQRQRIAIARALLRNPDILILDEATSALDSVSERLIQEALEKLSVGRTVVAIAHRLSTIASADKVIVLEQGRIVEQGTYQELLEQQGKLWKYHQMQYEMGQSS